MTDTPETQKTIVARAPEFPLDFEVAIEDVAMQEVGYKVATMLKYRCEGKIAYELLFKAAPEFAQTHGDLFLPISAEFAQDIISKPLEANCEVPDTLYAGPSSCGNVIKNIATPTAWTSIEECLSSEPVEVPPAQPIDFEFTATPASDPWTEATLEHSATLEDEEAHY
jgi:hypothetical protein